MNKRNRLDSPFMQTLIEQVAVALDKDNALWDETYREQALLWIMKKMGKKWTIGDLFSRFGENETMAMIKQVMERRRQLLERINKILEFDSQQNKCDLCGLPNPVCSVEFGVSRVLQTKRDWSSTAISIAISAVTLPLLGVVGLSTPGRQTSSEILRLRFHLCNECSKRRKGRRGKIKLSVKDCSRHSAIPLAAEVGFTKVLAPFQLPER